MLLKKTVFILFLLVISILSKGQNNKLNIGAELRPRLIINSGYKSPIPTNQESIIYSTQRTRISSSFINTKYECFVSFQDIRIWGNDDNYNKSGAYGNKSSTSLHNGWVKLLLKNNFYTKIGRQSFSFDDQRIISERNWNDYQVSYDAVLFVYNKKSSKLNIAICWNADNKNSNLFPKQKFRLFDFVHYEKAFQNLKLKTIGVITGNNCSDTSETMFYRGTYGISTELISSFLRFNSSIYYQHNLNEIGPKTSAYCLSVYIEKPFLANNAFIGAGLDYISGNSETQINHTNHQFDLLYGRRHGWYGYMDYFSTTPDQGLMDYMIKAKCSIRNKINFHVDFHHFLLAENKLNIKNSDLMLDKKLGQEIDIKLKWTFVPNVSIECGYSIYFMTKTLKQLKNIQDYSVQTPQFAYIVLTVKPSFHFYTKD